VLPVRGHLSVRGSETVDGGLWSPAVEKIH